jgi:hypothetical protein
MTRQSENQQAAATIGSEPTATATTVWAWVAARGDFSQAQATRVAPDTYELLDAPDGSDLVAGDQVKCELSDGELVVRERVFRTRMG